MQRADAALVGLRALRRAGGHSASSAGCSFAHAAILTPDPTGSGSVVIHVGTGAIGNGVCDAAHRCFVIVNNASSTDPADTKKIPIRFSS